MDLKKTLLIIFLVVVLSIAVLLVSGVVVIVEEEKGAEEETRFNIIEMGRAGQYGYVIYDFAGEGNITLISYRKEALREITIIDDDEGIEMGRLEEFAEMFKSLEKYGYDIKISDRRKIGDGIYVVPTGAMPTYVLDDILNNVTDGVVIYVGSKNYLLRGGLTERNWYDELTPEQKDRILVYESTSLGEYMEEEEFTIADDIIENKWSFERKKTYNILGDGRRTSTIEMTDGNYIRVLYDLKERKGITDSVKLKEETNILNPAPGSVYPWEDSTLTFYLNKSNGTAFLSVSKDGNEVKSEMLRRVTNGSVFVKRLQFKEPGDYILRVRDNTGTIASGILHLKNLEIVYAGKTGFNYFFRVMVDGAPLDDAEVTAGLKDSEMRKTFYVDGGDLVMGAKLEKGENIFVIDIEGTTKEVPVTYAEESILDFYINYLTPGIVLILIVYVVARFSRKPVYVLRASEGSGDIRKEIKIRKSDVLEAFRMIRRDIKIGNSPITTHEFEMALKRYVTKGADVTEGNVEELLKRLVDAGILQSYRHYYQFADEKDIKEKVLLRMAREALIESGINFRKAKDKFVAKDYEVGLFSAKFDKKAIIVVDREGDIRKIYNSLDEKGKTKLRIKEANGMITFVTIDRLGEVL
jgi:uncharacterized DUF497 family protein